MKKTLILLSFLFTNLFAQKRDVNYYTFYYDKKLGISDCHGKEVQPPKFNHAKEIKKKNVFILVPEDYNAKQLYFDLNIGAAQEYDVYTPNEVQIQDQSYSLIRIKNKCYIKNEIDNDSILFENGYYKIQNLGDDCIIASYFYTPPKKIIKRGTKTMSSAGYEATDIFPNAYPLALKMKIDGEFVSPLYAKNNSESNSSVGFGRYVRSVNIAIPSPDYLLFRNGNKFIVLDYEITSVQQFDYVGKKLGHIDKYEVPQEIIDKCSMLIGKKLSTYSEFDGVPVMASTPSGSNWNNVPSAESDTLPKWETRKDGNGNYLLIKTHRKKEDIVLRCPYSITYYDQQEDRLSLITIKSEPELRFYLDTEGKRYFVPSKYIDEFKLEFYPNK